MLHVHTAGRHVASISKQHPGAEGYRADEPWLLLHVDGRVRRFGTQRMARDEAMKLWAPCSFTRN